MAKPYQLRQSGWFALLLIGMVVFAYHRLPTYEYFQLDDPVHLEKNTKMDPVTFSNVLSFWTEPYENAYMPVSYTVWSLLAPVARREIPDLVHGKFYAQPFRWLSLAVHLIVSVLLFILIFRYFQDWKVAFLGGALFALHPIQVEVVSWITGLRGLLVGLFCLASLYYYDRFRRDSQSWAYYAGLVCFFVATLAKPTAYVFLGMIALLEMWLNRSSLRLLIRQLLPWALAPLMLVPLHFRLNNGVADRAVPHYPGFDRIFLMADSFTFYLKQVVLPLTFVVDYGKKYAEISHSSEAKVWFFGWILLAALLYRYRRESWVRALGFSLLLFIVGLLPVSGVVPFIFQHISSVADRYVYLSMIAPAFLVAWLCLYQPRWQKIMGIVIALLGVKTLVQVPVWESHLSLYAHNYEKVNNSWLVCNNLANAYERQGRYPEALKYYQEATKHADFPAIWNNVGALAIKTGEKRIALDAFRRVLKQMPNSAEAHNNMAIAWAIAGRKDIAARLLERAYALDPKMQGLRAEDLKPKNLKVDLS